MLGLFFVDDFILYAGHLRFPWLELKIAVIGQYTRVV